MDQLSYIRLIILVLVTLLCVVFFYKYSYSTVQRMYYTFSLAGILIYSGVSTLFIGFCDEYFLPYIIFQCVFTVSMVIGIRLNIKIKDSHLVLLCSTKQDKKKALDYHSSATEGLSDTMLLVCVLLFFSYYIVQLIYPTFRIGDLFHITLDIDNIFERRDALRGGVIYQIFYYLNLSMVALTFVYMYRKWQAGKWVITVGIFGLWYYLQMTVLGYISRNEMMICLIFIIAVFVNRHRNKIKISTRFIALGIVTVIILIPFLNAYELLRMGVITGREGIVEAFSDLVQKECYYGKFYDFCKTISNPILVLRYLVWIITLPLPSVIFGFVKNFGLPVNTYFTVLYTGISEGSRGYSVVLPSILGESLMIYGGGFYWIQSLILGLLIGKVCTCIEKNRELTLLNVFFAVNSLTLGRGGSESVLANMINYMIIYLIVMRFMPKKSNLYSEKEQME